jgi:hypothetical protein
MHALNLEKSPVLYPFADSSPLFAQGGFLIIMYPYLIDPSHLPTYLGRYLLPKVKYFPAYLTVLYEGRVN